jgi:trimeric autotransporter adhesin
VVTGGSPSSSAPHPPVVASDPTGSLTGRKYPSSLVQPDKSAFEPRIAIAWRPLAGSSLVIRSGYGVYYNTSVYQTIATQMAQQSPLSKSLSVPNSAANPLTLANGLNVTPANTPNTFGIDPNFRVGYAQVWQTSVQRDLPGSLQMTATYLGIKGTRQMQEFLPNTYAPGAANPCPLCPVGYAYLMSNGNSTREAGQLQLRRRLHSGFTATLQYTYSKSIDDAAALGGQPGFSQSSGSQNGQGPGGGIQIPPGPANLVIAQNWLNLRAERGLSSFDQRHLLNVQAQYTTGMGMAGGTLLSGWRGAMLKDWTVLTQITAGTGLPLTPIYLAPVPGTGFTGILRPNYTGADLYSPPAGFFLNPAAYVAPGAGEWGNAGRNSITGPAELSISASLGRTFRLSDRLNLDTRLDATNALNHVNFTAWNTTINNAQFGLPIAANAMRSVQITARVRF